MNIIEVENIILELIKDFELLSASEIYRSIKDSPACRNISVPMLNKILIRKVKEGKLRLDRSSYKYSIENTTNVKSGDFEKQEDNRIHLKFLIDVYLQITYDYQRFFRIDRSLRSKYFSEILATKSKLEEYFDKIIIFVVENEVSLTYLKSITNDSIYNQIISNNRIKNWIGIKEKDKIVDKQNGEEKLWEYEVLCKKVWDDGIITEEELVELYEKINELSLDHNKANEIFEKVKAEYDAKQRNEDSTSKHKEIQINNTRFLIKKSKLPFHPLFIYEFCKNTGKEIITINESHELYSFEAEKIILYLASSMHYTKLSMTSEHISIFIDRFHQNLRLIE